MARHPVENQRAVSDLDGVVEQAFNEISATGLSQVHNAIERILARVESAAPGLIGRYRERVRAAAERALNDRPGAGDGRGDADENLPV